MQQPRTTRGDVPERILAAACRLFLSQGYQQTGVNQIIAEARTAKASFYQYFPGKDDLGRAYLREYGRRNLATLERLTRRNPAPLDFIAAWVRYLKREARQSELYGCPMANLRAQIAEASPELHQEIGALARETIARLAAFLCEARRCGRIASDLPIPILARRLFAAYEGVLQTWRLTADAAALDDLRALAQAILAE